MRALALTAVSLLALAGCGPVSVDPVCAQYVACLADRDVVQGLRTDTSTYGDQGACWENADNAEHCAAACANGLQWLRDTDAQRPESCG